MTVETYQSVEVYQCAEGNRRYRQDEAERRMATVGKPVTVRKDIQQMPNAMQPQVTARDGNKKRMPLRRARKQCQ